MIRSEADHVVKVIFEATEILREFRPDLVFEAVIVPWTEHKFHVEVMARRSMHVDSSRKIFAKDLLTRDHGDIMTFHRIQAMYKDISHQEGLAAQRKFTELRNNKRQRRGV